MNVSLVQRRELMHQERVKMQEYENALDEIAACISAMDGDKKKCTLCVGEYAFAFPIHLARVFLRDHAGEVHGAAARLAADLGIEHEALPSTKTP